MAYLSSLQLTGIVLALLCLMSRCESLSFRALLGARCFVLLAGLCQLAQWLLAAPVSASYLRLSVIVLLPVWLMTLAILLCCRKGTQYKRVMIGLLAIPVLQSWVDVFAVYALPQVSASLVLHVHIIFAVVSAVFIIVLGVAAFVVRMQEHYLRERPNHRLLTWLPALASMERVFFRLLALSVFSLFVVVVTGALLPSALPVLGGWWFWKFGLACVACVTFAVILLGHCWFGWRVRQVVVATLLAALVLILVFLGSQEWLQ